VQDVGTWIELLQLREDLAEPREILRVISLARRELQRGKLESGRHCSKMRVQHEEG
jgi:hypothetical protein